MLRSEFWFIHDATINFKISVKLCTFTFWVPVHAFLSYVGTLTLLSPAFTQCTCTHHFFWKCVVTFLRCKQCLWQKRFCFPKYVFMHAMNYVMKWVCLFWKETFSHCYVSLSYMSYDTNTQDIFSSVQ